MSTHASDPPADLAGTAARGAVVTLGGQVVRIGVQMVGIALLARLVTPRDYGLVAMVMVIVSLGEVFRDFGLSAAAVQARTLSSAQRDNLFWANTLLGSTLCLGVVAASGLVARFYHEPLVGPIAQALALTFVLNGVAAQYRADLTRRMRFAALTAVDVGAQVGGLAVGIALALAGWGYWALVAQQLALAGSAMLALAVLGRWWPSRPRRGADMRGFWSYGGHLVATQVVTFLGNNADSLVIGRRFGATSLGLYDRAYRLIMLPLAQVRSPATTVALPVLSRISDDQQRYGRFLVRGQLALGYSLVAALGFAAGAAVPLVQIVLGPQWAAAAPILAVLALAGALQTLPFVGYWVYLSRGLTKYLFQYSILDNLVRVLAILVGSSWGVLGVAWGVALAPAVMWMVSFWWLSRVTPLPLRALYGGGLRILGMTLGCAGLVCATVDHVPTGSAWLQAAAGAVAALTFYAVVGLLVPAVRRDEAAVLDVARRVRPRAAVAGR